MPALRAVLREPGAISTFAGPFAENGLRATPGKFRTTASFQLGLPTPAPRYHSSMSPPSFPAPLRPHTQTGLRPTHISAWCARLAGSSWLSRLSSRTLRREARRDRKRCTVETLGRRWRQTMHTDRKWSANELINLPGGPGDPLDLGRPGGVGAETRAVHEWGALATSLGEFHAQIGDGDRVSATWWKFMTNAGNRTHLPPPCEDPQAFRMQIPALTRVQSRLWVGSI